MPWFTRDFLIQNARFVLLLLLLVLVAAAVYLFHDVLLPFALAIFLAYLLAPVIDQLTRLHVKQWHMPRGLAIVAVYAVVLGVIALSGVYLFPRFYSEVNRMVRTLPDTLHQVEDTFVRPVETVLNRWVSEFAPVGDPTDLGTEVQTAPPTHKPGTVSQAGNADRARQPGADNPLRALVEDYTYVVRRVDENHFEVVPQKRRPLTNSDGRQTFEFNRQVSHTFAQLRQSLQENLINFVLLGRSFVRAVVTSFFTLFLVLMISGFLLVDPERVHRFARSLVPTHYQDAFDDWLHGLDHGLSGVVRGQAIICAVNGVMTGIGISILGIPFVVTLSVIAAVFSLIPIFGVLISTLPIVIMALTVSVPTALLAVGWILVIHFIEGNFLNPKILGDSAKIHPVLVVFALLVGEHFAGVLGALLAVPIFSLVQNSFLFLKQKAESIESTA